VNARSTIVTVPYRGARVDIEHAWLNPGWRRAPLIVFLHEGLGSVSTWRDFPRRFCAAGGFRGLVYSRPGYGRSTRRPPHERWAPTFLHEQACELLPALLAALGVDSDGEPVWLVGHSDGGSIALIFAATFPQRAAGLVLLAPHIFVEDVSITSIKAARAAYWAGPLRDRLARHHRDPASAFLGWNEAWLDPAFRSWDITPLLSQIECPVLAVQGRNDEYGTLAQIEGIGRAVPDAELVPLDACGHAVHRDQPERLAKVAIEFIERRSEATRTPIARGQTWTRSHS
jgi:pimeloyl-ACP methyl ester carboxylesterase